MLTMEEAMKQSVMRFAVGEIVKGTIIEVRPKEVLVDIGYKSEGVIPTNEFLDANALKIGDEIDVLIEKLENKDGTVELSHEKAEFKKNWERILTICNEGGTILGKVKSVVKGGLVVNIGVEAFLPASQIDVITPRNLAQFVNNTYEFKVVKINQERQNIVLSRRELIEQERNEKRAKLLAEMVPGDIRKGTVKNITDFGAFIELNGIDGLLHITDMSWGRINHPSEILKVGQEIDVVVLDVNKEKERVSLGLKQKMANPWDNIETKYPVGAKVKGKVVSLVPYGAFVQLEPGVEGLVHVTELSWTKRIAKPSDVLKADQEIEAIVLGINREEQKISLGIRQLETNPWDRAMDKYPAGTKVKEKKPAAPAKPAPPSKETPEEAAPKTDAAPKPISKITSWNGRASSRGYAGRKSRSRRRKAEFAQVSLRCGLYNRFPRLKLDDEGADSVTALQNEGRRQCQAQNYSC